MEELRKLTKQLSNLFQQATMRECHSISIEEYRSGAVCLWYNVCDYCHYVIRNFPQKPSRMELLNTFGAFLQQEQNRIDDCRRQLTSLALETMKGDNSVLVESHNGCFEKMTPYKPKIEVESFAKAVEEITGKPPTNNEDSEWHDPLSSPNPFGKGGL